jgi:hypothetical protein
MYGYKILDAEYISFVFVFGNREEEKRTSFQV